MRGFWQTAEMSALTSGWNDVVHWGQRSQKIDLDCHETFSSVHQSKKTKLNFYTLTILHSLAGILQVTANLVLCLVNLVIHVEVVVWNQRFTPADLSDFCTVFCKLRPLTACYVSHSWTGGRGGHVSVSLQCLFLPFHPPSEWNRDKRRSHIWSCERGGRMWRQPAPQNRIERHTWPQVSENVVLRWHNRICCSCIYASVLKVALLWFLFHWSRERVTRL